MRDLDIRLALREGPLARFLHDGESLIVPEMGISQGDHRIDLAVVNGALHGYEIKSERDTLVRLPAQAAAYGSVFDYLTLVVADSYVERAAAIVPAWWNIVVAEGRDGRVHLRDARRGARNPGVKARVLVELLWKDEVLEELEARGGARGFRGSSRKILWEELVTRISDPAELGAIVRGRLKARTQWRQ